MGGTGRGRRICLARPCVCYRMSPVKYVHIGEGELRRRLITLPTLSRLSRLRNRISFHQCSGPVIFYFPFSACEGHLSVRSYTVATGTEVDRSKKHDTAEDFIRSLANAPKRCFHHFLLTRQSTPTLHCSALNLSGGESRKRQQAKTSPKKVGDFAIMIDLRAPMRTMKHFRCMYLQDREPAKRDITTRHME